MATKAKETEPIDPREITFTFDGLEFTVPTGKYWPIEVVEAQEQGMFATAIRKLLGPKQYAAFCKKPRTMEDLEKLTDALLEAADLDKGE